MHDVEGVSTFEYRVRGYNGPSDHGNGAAGARLRRELFLRQGSFKTAFGSS